MKKINLEKLAGEVIRNLQENATNIFSKYSITSTRSVGDTIQNYLGDKCFPELLKKYSVTDVVNHTGGKDFPDITFTHGGIEYVIDVKTQRENTKFNMPNITSLERIKKFYTNKKRVFLVLIVRYSVKNDMVEYKECFIQPIENISWKSLIISGLGNGQIQIKNANDIEFNKTSRKNWMNNLYNEQYKFYNKQINKWQGKINAMLNEIK